MKFISYTDIQPGKIYLCVDTTSVYFPPKLYRIRVPSSFTPEHKNIPMYSFKRQKHWTLHRAQYVEYAKGFPDGFWGLRHIV